MLLSEKNTPDTERKIVELAYKEFGTKAFDVVYEHGHWWVTVRTGLHRRLYDVVDANTSSGLAFELIEEKREDD